MNTPLSLSVPLPLPPPMVELSKLIRKLVDELDAMFKQRLINVKLNKHISAVAPCI